jgi:hypothetical protein
VHGCGGRTGRSPPRQSHRPVQSFQTDHPGLDRYHPLTILHRLSANLRGPRTRSPPHHRRRSRICQTGINQQLFPQYSPTRSEGRRRFRGTVTGSDRRRHAVARNPLGVALADGRRSRGTLPARHSPMAGGPAEPSQRGTRQWQATLSTRTTTTAHGSAQPCRRHTQSARQCGTARRSTVTRTARRDRLVSNSETKTVPRNRREPPRSKPAQPENRA